MATHESSWPLALRNRLQRFLDMQASDPANCAVMYWCSDAWGRSANSGSTDMVAAPWTTQTVEGPLEPCSSRALHATQEPHQWKGVRVWVVALIGERQDMGEKSAALKREIIAEVLPGDVICPKLAARMNLSGANLYRADLSRADLSRADLSGANLYGADLSGANLYGADLAGANLSRANLYGANLYGTDLYGANLSGADLSGADLSGADLDSSERPKWLPEQWIVTGSGHIARKS